MRKLVCALMAALLLLSTLALAEAETGYTGYVNKNNGYTLNYPTGWTLMDKENIDKVMEAAESGAIEGLDGAAVAGYREQMETMDMMMCVAPDGMVNFNVLYQQLPDSYTAGQLVEQLCPATLQQLQSTLSDLTVVDSGSVYTAGENEYAMISAQYVLGGMNLALSQLMVCSGTTLYVITFTVTLSEDLDVAQLDAISEEVASSFAPPAVATAA